MRASFPQSRAHLQNVEFRVENRDDVIKDPPQGFSLDLPRVPVPIEPEVSPGHEMPEWMPAHHCEHRAQVLPSHQRLVHAPVQQPRNRGRI